MTALKSIDIHRQGSLDSCCGIYAVLNSIAMLAEGEIDIAELFGLVLHKIGGQLASVMLEGMTIQELKKYVLATCVAYCAEQAILLRVNINQNTSTDDCWQSIVCHHGEFGDGSIVLCIDDHWTCIRRATKKSLLLADSQDGLYRIFRRHISIVPNQAKYHLTPNMIILMSVEK